MTVLMRLTVAKEAFSSEIAEMLQQLMHCVLFEFGQYDISRHVARDGPRICPARAGKTQVATATSNVQLTVCGLKISEGAPGGRFWCRLAGRGIRKSMLALFTLLAFALAAALAAMIKSTMRVIQADVALVCLRIWAAVVGAGPILKARANWIVAPVRGEAPGGVLVLGTIVPGQCIVRTIDVRPGPLRGPIGQCGQRVVGGGLGEVREV